MICLIGNSGLKKHGVDGQTAKVRLYLKKIKDEGNDTYFIDLEGFLVHPFSILRRIKKGIKICDRIILITAERGCKVLIPYINRLNKKYKKDFILPLVGTSVLHYSIDKLTDEEKNDFIINGNYSLVKPDKFLTKQLSKISYILPETELLTRIFREYYKLSNVYTLNNFRDVDETVYQRKVKSDILRVVFLSRVMREKGIFDLLEVIKTLNDETNLIQLDIYGKKFLDNADSQLFDTYLCHSIRYNGVLEHSKVIETLSQHDLFIFPTRFIGEGTPGVIVESLLAGTPVITSDFPQARLLLEDGMDSFFYKMGDLNELRKKIKLVLESPDLLKTISINAFEHGKLYTYNVERNKFLKYICGKGDI